MYLRSVKLINWRSYCNETFRFPRPSEGRNVILVMAPNEHGKTSFLEAVTLGLFGRNGLHLIPRARTAAGRNGEERLSESYSTFLQKALHRKAIETGVPECVVGLEWEDEHGDPIEIRRTWHFRFNGSHKSDDDQLLVYEGRDRRPVGPPQSEVDHEGWYREWIASNFLAPDVAEFFLFDGEQVQRYANRSMSNQVRSGIQGLLGLPVLRNLKESLNKYAQNRRKSVTTPDDTTVQRIEDDIDSLENRIRDKQAEYDNANSNLPNLDDEIAELTQHLGTLGGENTIVSLVANLLQDEQRQESEAQRSIDALIELISGDLALAIAGTPLRKDTIDRLAAEEKKETWETGREAGNRNLDLFVADLLNRIKRFERPVSVEQREAVAEAARASWEALWHPPPGCADEYLHGALAGAARAGAIDRLKEAGGHSATEAADYVQSFETASAAAEAAKRERLELERRKPETERQMERLKDLSEQRGRYEQQRIAAQREVDAGKADLNKKRAELGRYAEMADRHSPALSYAKRAVAYADLIEGLVESAVPHQVEDVADRMTCVWKAMAHMSDRVERIEISTDCEVKMLAEDGTNLREIDPSAGASQVFTLALITAITEVSGRVFPFIVDTPLARLSREQRLGVLKTFTNRPSQVILLSTDQEVVDDKFEAIRHRIAAMYRLEVAHTGGVVVTTARELDPGGA